MQQLPPLLMRAGYWKPIEEEIDRVLRELIYKPLLRLLASEHPEYHNAKVESLLDAVREGLVWYQDGRFSGTFNAKISADLKKLGAQFHGRSKTWTLEPELVPPDIRIAQARADSRYDALRRGFLKTLAEANIDSIDKLSKIADNYKKTIEWMNGDFEKAVRAISIPPKLTEAQRAIIADEWGRNLNKYIKSWADKTIFELRDLVQANTFAGRRAEALEDVIRENYGVSQRKAQFLARQETSLLMSKFRETRYGQIGVKRYRWSTSHDERVRSDHKHLNGKVFSFDSPPVTNARTGARNNPGEDFGCRCVAVGLVD